MKLSDFDYSLPKEFIAQKAVDPKDTSKLLVIANTENKKEKDKKDQYIFEDRHFYDLTKYLVSGDVIVLNSTRVVKAKLIGNKSTGSPAEIILIKNVRGFVWECRIKTRNPLIGQKIYLKKRGNVKIIGKKESDIFLIRLSSKKILDDAILPNPPYIKRTITDFEYQTVYAKDNGSLAAPTAGLHFTNELLTKIRKIGVKTAYIQLHVGYGTFLPVCEDIKNHKTESEYCEISKKYAKIINNRKGRLIVVGTTTLKALETLSFDKKILSGKVFSDIFIFPGYKFKSGADILITNFHLPKSSLILLTCAFGGTRKVLQAYNHALKNNYRFYSLGDSMMLQKDAKN